MSEEASAVIPHRAEIRCNNAKDEYVQEFISHFRFKKLDFELIVEERSDIDVKLFDVLGTLIDNFGLPHYKA